jgi:hypothetical protein
MNYLWERISGSFYSVGIDPGLFFAGLFCISLIYDIRQYWKNNWSNISFRQKYYLVLKIVIIVILILLSF